MKQEVIEIDGMKIIVTEIKVKTARKVLANVVELFQGDVNVEVLLNDKYDLLVDIAGDFVIMPDGNSIDDLTYGDIKDKLFPIFKAVNQSFLEDMMNFIPSTGLLQDQESDQPLNPSPKTSIKQSSD